MAVNINESRALTPPAGMPFKIQRLGHVVLNYDLRKDTGRVYGDTTKRPARGRR